MIHQALGILITELNHFLHLRLGNTNANNGIWAIPNNLVSQNGTPTTGIDRRIVVSLVNMEEDRISRSTDRYRKQPNGLIDSINQEIRFNLFLLFTAYFPDSLGDGVTYMDGLKALSGVVSFFQLKNVFDKNNSPNLPSAFEKLTMEHYSLTLEQQNHLWGALGSKYLPSVMYKMRLIVFQEDNIQASGPPILTVEINSNDSNV